MASLLRMIMILIGATTLSASAAAQPRGHGPHVLIFSHSTGYRHASIEAGIAAFQAMGASPRGQTSLKVAVGELFATRCATCGRSLVVDDIVWPDQADAATDDLGARSEEDAAKQLTQEFPAKYPQWQQAVRIGPGVAVVYKEAQ